MKGSQKRESPAYYIGNETLTKLGSGNMLDEAAGHLLKLRDRVDTQQMKKPEFLMVVYGGQHEYRRPDGDYVVPIGCLRD